MRLQKSDERRPAWLEIGGLRLPRQTGAALDPVQSAIPQNTIPVADIRQPIPSPQTARPAHFEDVSEVRIEQKGDGRLDGVQRVVRDANSLDRAALPEQARPGHVNLAARNGDRALVHHIGVCEVRCEDRVVIAASGAQKQRTLAAEQQFETGQKSSAVVIKTLLARFSRHHVAVLIEHGKAVAVLEHTHRRGRALGVRDDIERFIEPYGFGHRSLQAAAVSRCRSITCSNSRT